MTVTIQGHNGTTRRIRGTFGGNQAYKQHEVCDCGLCGKGKRNRLLARITEDLADEQMRDLQVNGDYDHKPKNRGRRRPAQDLTLQGRDFAARPVYVPTITSVAKAPAPKPRFKVVVNESGKMVALLLD